MARAVEEIYMVSPETAKLLELKESILKDSPKAKIYLSAQADKDIADMDMIVTATSGAGKKVLDSGGGRQTPRCAGDRVG